MGKQNIKLRLVLERDLEKKIIFHFSDILFSSEGSQFHEVDFKHNCFKHATISQKDYNLVRGEDLVDRYTVFTNGGHAGKNCGLVMKARRWRVNKNCK